MDEKAVAADIGKMSDVEKALLGVTAAGGVGIGAFLLWKYFIDDSVTCTENEVICKDERLWKCVGERWVDQGVSCLSTYKCSNCEAEGCSLVFGTYEDLARHLNECHGYPGSIYREETFKSVEHPKGAKVFEYWFCRTYLLSLVSGVIYPCSADRPWACVPKFEVYVYSKGSWVSLGTVGMTATHDEEDYLPTTYAFTAGMPVDAIRFRGFGSGWTCGGWDARADAVTMEALVSIHDPKQVNRECERRLVGWEVEVW